MGLSVLFEVVVGSSAVVTMVAAVGGFSYIRDTRQDASTAVRLLRGTEASPGIIERVEDVEAQADDNTERTARHRRVLRREGILNPNPQENAD